MSRKYTPSFGFTLVELMIIIAIVSVLISLAAPSFNSLLSGTRLTNAANTIVSALQLARSEAVKRVSPVSIIANNGNWKNGGIVFVDLDKSGVQLTDGTEPSVGTFDAMNTDMYVYGRVADNPTTPTVITAATTTHSGFATYRSDGRIDQGASDFYVCSKSGDFRRVLIAATGRVKVEAPPNVTTAPSTFATACPSP